MYNSYHWFGSTICFLAAVYFGFQFFLHKNEADNAASWARITGVMETMTMSTSTGRRSGHTYTPHVAYKFTVNGETHRGGTISYPDPSFYKLADSTFFQKQYPEGGLISVYYNAKDPTQCCLIPGERAPLNHEGWYALGLLALAVVLPLFPDRSYGYGGYGGMYNNPTSMITPSRK
jgi:hypothetical protein